MKKIISVIVATLVAMSFTAAAFAVDAAPVTAPAAESKLAVEKKDDSKPCDCNKTKKHKKHKKAKKEIKAAPATDAAPAAK
jgi:hypothetical protein